MLELVVFLFCLSAIILLADFQRRGRRLGELTRYDWGIIVLMSCYLIVVPLVALLHYAKRK